MRRHERASSQPSLLVVCTENSVRIDYMTESPTVSGDDRFVMLPADYARWLCEEPDPRDLMRPFPADLMRMWPISTRVNKPENDDPSIIEPIELATDAA